MRKPLTLEQLQVVLSNHRRPWYSRVPGYVFGFSVGVVSTLVGWSIVYAFRFILEVL